MFAKILKSLGVPYGIRTRVAAVKGRCPGPLDERDRAVPRVADAPGPVKHTPLTPPACGANQIAPCRMPRPRRHSRHRPTARRRRATPAPRARRRRCAKTCASARNRRAPAPTTLPRRQPATRPAAPWAGGATTVCRGPAVALDAADAPLLRRAGSVPVMSDRWIRRMAQEHGMIEPFVESAEARRRHQLRPVQLRLRRPRRRRVQDLHQRRFGDRRSEGVRAAELRRPQRPTSASSRPTASRSATRSSISAFRATCW